MTFEREEKAEQLQYLWMGTNLKYKGIKEVLNELNSKDKFNKSSESTIKEVNNEWRRLIVAMRGKK